MFSNRHLLYLLLFRTSRSIAAGMITLAFPYLVLSKYHYGSLTLGLIYTAAAVATALAGLLVGFLADLWGRKRSLWLVGLMLPVSSAMVLGTHHLAWLFVAAALGGYSATGSLIGGGVGGAAQPVQTAIIASLAESKERTSYFSVFSFLGGVCAAGGSLAARLFTTRDVFAAATVVAGAGLVFLIPLRLPEPAGKLRSMQSGRVIGQFSLTGMLNGFSQGLIMPFLIPFFVLVYHLPKDRMAVYSFASGVLGALALLTAPKLDQWLGFVRAIAWTRGVGAAMIVLLPLWHNLPLALGIYMLIPALRVAALPTQQRALTDMVRAEETGRALGFNQVMRLGASSGAVALTGFLFEETDFALPFELYSAIMVANIFLYFRFFGQREQRPAQMPVEVTQESEGR